MMVVVVASNLMRRVFVLFNNVRVACSVVGNPMICGSNAGAGECAAALPPVTVPFPLESTPGGSSEHSSFLPLCLSFISTASQAGQLARLAASRAQCFSALSRSAWRGVHACVAAAAAFVPLPRRGSGRGDTVLSAWGRRRSRLRPGIPVVGCMPVCSAGGAVWPEPCICCCSRLGISVWLLCVCARAGTGTGAAAAGRSKAAGARLPIGVGTSLGASSLVLFAVSCFLWRRKRRHTGGRPSSVLGILHGTSH